MRKKKKQYDRIWKEQSADDEIDARVRRLSRSLTRPCHDLCSRYVYVVCRATFATSATKFVLLS